MRFVRPALWLTLAACASPLFTGARRPLETKGAVPAAECGRCHEDELAHWRRSQHARAWVDPVFRASFSRARMRSWCLNCHVPLDVQQSALRAGRAEPLLDEGVTCVTCHVRDGVVLGPGRVTEAGLRAHPQREEPRLATSAFCGNCHQFAQPVLDHFPLVDTTVMAQDTVREAAHFEPGRTCQACHFRTHDARGGAHDLEGLKAALQVEVVERALRLSLRGVGHRFPTGDPFRLVLIDACRDEGCEARAKRWVLGRSLELQPDGGIVETRDTRLMPGEQRDFHAPGDATHWRVTFVFTEPELPITPEQHAVVLAEGRF